MPIEIKELHIRVTVNTTPAKPPSAGQAQPLANGDATEKDALVSECVEQVLQILQGKRDR